MVEMKCNWCHLLVCSSLMKYLQLLFLGQLKLLSKIWRTRNVIVDAQDFRLRIFLSMEFIVVAIGIPRSPKFVKKLELVQK